MPSTRHLLFQVGLSAALAIAARVWCLAIADHQFGWVRRRQFRDKDHTKLMILLVSLVFPNCRCEGAAKVAAIRKRDTRGRHPERRNKLPFDGRRGLWQQRPPSSAFVLIFEMGQGPTCLAGYGQRE